MARAYWLMKTEPEVFSLADLRARPQQTEPWDGIRNYQARNFMRDAMQPGDPVLFYHSNCAVPGVVGIAEIASTARPDPTALDPKSAYFDTKSTSENPRWLLVDVRFVEAFPGTLSLADIKADPVLAEMAVARKGNRLSITPVERKAFERARQLGRTTKAS